MLTTKAYRDLLQFRTGPVCRSDGPTPEITYYVAQGYLKVTENDVLPGFTIRPIAWSLTPAGELALSEYEEALEKEDKARAEDRGENRRNRNTQVITAVISALLSSLLTLAVEHFGEICNFLTSHFIP